MDNSEDYSGLNINYGVSRSTLSSTTELAPDGTNTATKLVRRTNGNGRCGMIGNGFGGGATIGTTYTSSVFVKYLSGSNSNQVIITNVDANAAESDSTFNVETGAIVSSGSQNTSSIVQYPNGWYRISVTRTASTNGAYFWVRSENQNEGDGFLVWGAQIEAGAFATSYIPTSGSTVTRAQDTAKITGTNFTDFYNQEEGTLVAHYYSTVDDGYLAQFENVTTPGDDRIGFVNYAGYQGFVETGNSTQASLDNGTPTVGAFNKVAFAFKANDFAVSLNSATPSTDTSGTMPTVGRMMIGSRFGGQYDILKSSIRRLSYYPKRLPNAQLQGLTQQ